MKLEPGTVVDRYRVEAEIGRGGMARVYRVRHSTLDTVHALKVLTVSGEELRERLVREGRVQARLDHPNVVPVRDILDLPHGQGLLMDYIDGPSLDEWLREHGPDAAERERIFTAVATGVGFAHAQGVVHRDLKPGNVMMQHRHGEWVPRVADFGLAKLLSAEEGEGMLQSRSGRPMGTPAYMAPEQVRSAKHVDARADVFALGCILYELFCGMRAFGGNDSLEVFNRITQGSFKPPREAVAELEPRIEQAISGALAVHADERIPDCETLLAVLRGEQAWAVNAAPSETFIGDFAIEPTPPPAPTAGGPGVAAATAVPAAEDLSSPPTLDGSLVPESDAGSLVPPIAAGPTPETERSRAVPLALALVAAVVLVGVVSLQLLGPTRPPEVSAPPPEPAAPAPLPAAPAPVPEEPAPTPVPSAAPAPAEPVPDPEPPPVPVAAPAPAPSPPGPKPAAGPPAGMGRIVITGDAKSVRFRGSGGERREAGDLPPGSYVIEAAFDDGPAMHAGNIDLRAGDTVRLRCSADAMMCGP